MLRSVKSYRDRPGLLQQVLSQNAGYLRTDGGKGRLRTAGEVRNVLGVKVSDTGTDQTRAQVAHNNLIDDGKRKQDDFNLAIEQGAKSQEATTKALREQAGLYGTALLDAQKRQAVTAAEQKLRDDAVNANKNKKPGEADVVVTDDQIKKARDVAAAYFDAAHAKEAFLATLADVQRPIDDLVAQRDLLKQQAEFLRSIGDNSAADQKDKQILGMGRDIDAAYDKLIKFFEALKPETDENKTKRVQLGIDDPKQLDNIIAKYKQAKLASEEWGKVLGIDGKQIAQTFSSSLANSVTNFIQKIAAGKNVFKSLGEGVREFAATFIQSIAQMLIQLEAYTIAVAILRALGAAVPGGGAAAGAASGPISGAAPVMSAHTGGVVGGSAGGQQRSVSPLLFANAMRYHTGGIVGLAPDEMGAVLRKGEEVLTTGDPRHRNNGGGTSRRGSSGPDSIKIVNVSNSADALSEALSTKRGEKVMMNHVQKNSRAYKAALG